MYKLIIVGAGPAGISMATEARKAGIAADQIIVLEKGDAHSWALRKFYPPAKLVTANYKGIDAVCTGVMCISDMSKEDTLTYIGRTIEEHQLNVRYNEGVLSITPVAENGFSIQTPAGTYQAGCCVIAIGILGKPNKPAYRIPAALSKRVHYDLTTTLIEDLDCLVVGGGDTASEYCQYLVQHRNRVTLSYRQTEFKRLNGINHESLMALEQRGQVIILRGSNIKQLEPDSTGRARVVFEEPAFPLLVVDEIVYALGGTTPSNFLKATGIAFEGDTPIIKEGYETSVPGLYVIGDLSAGRKRGSINLAFNMSAEAMRNICSRHPELCDNDTSGSGKFASKT